MLAAQGQALPTKSIAITLAQCSLDDDRDIDLAAAWSMLSAAEDARARRFHFDRDRYRYVRGRAFLRRQLEQATGQVATDLVLAEGPQGKPFLQDHGLWFNLSHSRDLAVLAISQDGPVGIDVEFIDRQIDIAGLIQSCMTPAEAAVLAALPANERQARFFAFWTAKEARMKLTGEGISLPPQQIVLDLREGVPVGYLRPDRPAAQATFLDLGNPVVQCCLALAQGRQPIIIPLIITAPLLSSPTPL